MVHRRGSRVPPLTVLPVPRGRRAVPNRETGDNDHTNVVRAAADEEETTMTDETTAQNDTVAPEADETFAWTGDGENGATQDETPSNAREWLSQLQSMIENITEQAGPVLRQVSAKAAELAVVAGEKAGPVAARAAELTAEAGAKLAERSRDLATELRRDQAAKAAGANAAAETAAADEDAAKD